VSDEIVKDFTVEEAKRILSSWADNTGYTLGRVKKLTLWLYTAIPFYSAEAWLTSAMLEVSGRFAFHIHQDGEVVKFKLEDPDFTDGNC